MSTGELNYRFLVYSPTGALLRTILRDEMTMRSTGFWARLTPEGDGQEANFTARGGPRDGAGVLDKPNWGIPCLSAVQIQYNLLGEWVPIYYGQVRQGGNPRDVNGENYVLRSLALRLGAVTLSPGFTTPRQAAHLTIRAMIQDVINSGQLGNPSLILYDAAKIPDLGFDCREITNANQQTPGALLASIVQQGMGGSPAVDVRFGVGPDRKFYCQTARADIAILTDSAVRGQMWKPPVAETPWTRVLWFVARRPDGRWLTHLSERQPNDPFGVWVKPLSLEASINPWEPVSGTYDTHPEGQAVQVNAKTDLPYLYDGITNTGSTYGFGGAVPSIYTQFTPGAGVRWDRALIAGSGQSGGGVGPGTLIGVKPAGNAVLLNHPSHRYFTGWGEVTVYPEGNEGYAVAPFIGTATTDPKTLANLQIAELRVERINTTLLDNLAKYHYSVPESEPSAIALKEFMSPAGLSGRVSYGTYARAVTTWEYRVDAGRGMELTAECGQPDDPIKAAQASLIRARDGAAVIESLTAQR